MRVARIAALAPLLVAACATPQVMVDAGRNAPQHQPQPVPAPEASPWPAPPAPSTPPPPAARSGPGGAPSSPVRRPPPGPPPGPPASLPADVLPLTFAPSGFSAIPAWADSDVGAARRALQRSCAVWAVRPVNQRLSEAAVYAGTVGQWDGVCARAADPGLDDRSFWEQSFDVWTVATPDGAPGRLTSYYEPLVRVSSVRTATMPEPIQSRPADLVTLEAGDFDPGLTGRTLVGRLQGSQLVPYPSRAEITPDSAPVLAWGATGDVLALQIQGSGRLLFEDGRQMRASFTATNGQPFRSVAQELIRRGQLERNQASADNITAWFRTAPPAMAREVLNANPRTVFFEMRPVTDPAEGPRGGAGLGLEPNGSGAVDLRYHPYGVPFFISASAPVLANSPDATIHRLLVAQDTGGAIRGPLRVDLFWGTGDEAGMRAGRVNHEVRWWVLLPRGLDPVAASRR